MRMRRPQQKQQQPQTALRCNEEGQDEREIIEEEAQVHIEVHDDDDDEHMFL